MTPARILVAARDRATADAMRLRLVLAGYDARFATTRPGLRKLRRGFEPDLLVVEMDLASDAGFDARGIPVIVLVSEGSGSARRPVDRTGVAMILEQPCCGSTLVEACRAVLDSGPSASVA